MSLHTRVLIVGINPSDKQNSKTLQRLNKWADELGIKYYSFVNCISKSGVYKASDIDYNTLSRCVEGYEKIITLGNFASSALTKLGINHHSMPHPSGLNRNLNDPAYEKQQLRDGGQYLND